MNTTNNSLSIPAPIYFGEENEMLDFNQIKSITENSRKKTVSSKSKDPVKIVLTEKQTRYVESLIGEVETYIKSYAESGKDKFTYDCSKLDYNIFFELIMRFKAKNPKFYVQRHDGTQLMVVEWTGKNEV
tara:strand:+ start:69 stop:458 length:390 start_codon:yes stop_codon:yes gene_type:complete